MDRPAAFLAVLAVVAVVPGSVGAAPANPTEGQVTFDETYVGAAHCADGANVDVVLSWQIKMSSGTYLGLTDPQYTITASTASSCPTENTAVKTLDLKTVAGTGQTQTYPGSGQQALTVEDFKTAVGYTCDAGDKTIYVCVSLRDGATGDSVGNAAGVFYLQVTAPNAPTGVVVTPSEQALNVAWTAPSTGPEVDYYEATAFQVGTTTVVSTVKVTSGTSGRIGGLVNGTVYDVAVRGFSLGGNEGPYSALSTSPAADRTPVPIDDFWEYYKDRGGAETGCASGGGLGALAALGVLAAMARRRRRA
jgi:hypothetical protein